MADEVRASVPRGGTAPPDGLLHRFLPARGASGREAFQLRFLAGGCLLGSAVALPSLGVTLWLRAGLESVILGAFLAGLALLLAAIRLGIQARAVAWASMAVVAVFLVAISLTTAQLRVEQLPWFLLLPLGAIVLVGPRADDPAGTLRAWPVAAAMLAALASVAFVVLAHRLGLTFDQPWVETPPEGVVLDFALLLASVVGLVYVYDLSARQSHAELQRLRQLLSVCAWCRQIKHEEAWIPLEQYLVRRHRSDLTHGICPACYEKISQDEPAA
jgi:hypothetical protein